jgi:O-antigen ligase
VSNRLWQQSSALLQRPLPGPATIAHNQPWLALGPTLSMALALICAFLVGLDRDRARMLTRVVALSGASYAVLGIAQYIFDPTQVLWRDKQAYTNSLTGPFINRNTAAVYFGVCAILWLLLLFDKIEHLLPSRDDAASLWRSLLTRSNEIQLPAVMFMLCLAAMLLTGSRAGVVISLVAMVAAPPLFFSRRLSRVGAVGIALAAGAGFALVLFETIGAGVSSRFELDQLATGGRWETYRSTLEIIADYPWLGTGLGTFAWIFPAYRSGSISIRGVWDRAHDTALELASEMGIPLTLMVAAGWVVIIAVLCHGIRNRRRDRIFPIAGCLVALVALLHSMIDFSLQIPGFALVVAALTGAGLAQSFRTGKRVSRMAGQDVTRSYHLDEHKG